MDSSLILKHYLNLKVTQLLIGQTQWLIQLEVMLLSKSINRLGKFIRMVDELVSVRTGCVGHFNLSFPVGYQKMTGSGFLPKSLLKMRIINFGIPTCT